MSGTKHGGYGLPADFRGFWNACLEKQQQSPVSFTMTPNTFYSENIRLYEVIYQAMDGTPIHGWLLLPHFVGHPVPVVVRYPTYYGNRGFPVEGLHWIAMGLGYFTVDVRGQGGLSPDYARYEGGSSAGWLTKGILDPHHYYYKYVYMDAVRALDVLSTLNVVNADRIIVTGRSQGAAIALVVAALDPRPKIVLAVNTFLCNFDYIFRNSLHQEPYEEFTHWFLNLDPQHHKQERIMRTLSYFDVLYHMPYNHAASLFITSGQDKIAPSEAVISAFHQIRGEKEWVHFPDNGHAHMTVHEQLKADFVSRYLTR
ncbi:acetylxylan esterase [Paenibacillus tyrfis]|uniref:acetylxylan esterase n=1 Tax=Paenibacillus tyrfis TaxID=1501230 RepID=UPI0020A01410|nr:acetylxylan esterase [Paenibacillus tyrfis]MCP1311567.1 acetylxylan esterase [Paenibacillus tyrfis]